MLSEISQTQKVTCCVIPFMRYIQNRKVHKDKQQIRGYQEMSERDNGELLLRGVMGCFLWGDGKILKLERADGCIALQIY